MEAASRLRITLKLLLSLDLTSHLKIGANTIVIVVRVYEIPPGIVGRVNIDCFDFSVIALLQELEDFEVVTFNQRSEEHTSELQSLMRISYAVFCLKKKKQTHDEPIQLVIK